jgi:hypothetical protein
MDSIDLNLVDISQVKNFSFAGIVTDCKVIKITSPNSITVLMNINNKYNIFNIRLDGYEISRSECKSCYKKIKNCLYNLLTSCNDKIESKMNRDQKHEILLKENKKILKIHLMDFNKYNEIYARIYLDDKNEFLDEFIIKEFELN